MVGAALGAAVLAEKQIRWESAARAAGDCSQYLVWSQIEGVPGHASIVSRRVDPRRFRLNHTAFDT
jgi:hypothetical protein